MKLKKFGTNYIDVEKIIRLRIDTEDPYKPCLWVWFDGMNGYPGCFEGDAMKELIEWANEKVRKDER